MRNAKPSTPLMDPSFPAMTSVKYAIWDLDGTIIDTETLCVEALSEVIRPYGKTLTPELRGAVFGRRPIDIYTSVVESLEIPERPETLIERSQEILEQRFVDASILPGVTRLLDYFSKEGIPMALATSTNRENIAKKLKGKEWIMKYFREIVGGNEVEYGKPRPDIFLLAAKKLNARVEECIVFEDSITGAKAAATAGMHVILVPSLPNLDLRQEATKGSQTEILKSLLDFNPISYGLPDLTIDCIDGVICMNPIITLSGTVIKGFGRGARELGIRTANIDDVSLAQTLSSAVTGIYSGWASVGKEDTVYKMVMSVGWNPYYKNEKKTAEAWLLHEFPEDFYGEHLRLVVCGYIRPECDFTTLEDLIKKIHHDAEVSKKFLDHPSIAPYKEHEAMKQKQHI